MSRSKIGVWHLLILACIATNAHAAPECKDDSWDVLSSRGGYDVCKTAEYLLQPGHCPGISNENHIPPISTTNPWYKAWGFSGASKCTCTSVVFHLLTACAGCQKWSLNEAMSQKWQNLTSYEGNSCTDFQSDGQAGGLQPQPNDSDSEWTTLVPWAVQMSSLDFNLQEAVAKANSSGVATNAPVAPSSTTSEPAPTSTTTPVANAASGKSGPNIGAIVGGVVGGVVLIGAIIGFLLFLHRRKRRTRDVAPSSEFLKPEYYVSPPLLPVQDRRDSEYRDDIDEEATPQMAPRTLSWVGGIVTTRRQEDNEDEMLPPFTQGTYIGPSPHEKAHPERRHTDESDATATSNTHLLSSSSRPGTSE